MTMHTKAGAYAGLLVFLINMLISVAWGQTPPANSLGIPNKSETTTAPTHITAEQAQDLIHTLEDETARKRLIEQLAVLAATQKTATPPVKSSTTALLAALSRQVENITKHIYTLAGSITQIPALINWTSKQFSDPSAQRLWQDALVKLIAIIGLGYTAYFIARRLIGLLARPFIERRSQNATNRLGWAMLWLLLGLIPIAAFLGTAYLMLGLMDLLDQTRLAVLAWINAILLSRLITLAGEILFAPHAPALRLVPVSDESAHYIEVWIRRLTLVPIYGYFALQASLFLGLERSLYESLLQFLGLIVFALLAIFVLQNRAMVARHIEGSPTKPQHFHSLRRQLAATWHLLLILYLFVIYVIWALALPGGFFYLLRSSGLTILAILIGQLLIRMERQLFKKRLDISDDLQQRYPGLQARANRYIPVVHTILHTLIYLLVFLAVLQAWGINTFGWLISNPGVTLTKTLVTIGSIIVIAIVIWEVTNYFIESYLTATDDKGNARVTSARTRTLLTVARKALLVLVSVLATLLVLSELGINIAPLLATAGVVGLAIGFGAQKLVQDLITGIFILLEDLFAVGDVIKVGDTSGVVEAVSIRNVRLRDLSGTVHTIPFSSISTISNLTKNFSYYVFNLGVAYRENVDQVMTVLTQIGEEMRSDEAFAGLILEPVEMFGVDQLADSSVIIQGRIKTVPIKQWTVGREFNRRVKNKFDELGIEIPFPHMTIYFGQDKQGNAPPVHIDLKPAR